MIFVPNTARYQWYEYLTNLNAHFMLNEFVTPVLIFCCNSYKLMSCELSEIIRLCKYACVPVNPICNSWHQQWHSVERPYSVNQQKRLNITAKCHNGVLSLIIDCRLTFYPSYQKKHPLWATAYCFNKMTWKCRSSPVTIQSSVHPSKESFWTTKLKGYLKLLKL